MVTEVSGVPPKRYTLYLPASGVKLKPVFVSFIEMIGPPRLIASYQMTGVVRLPTPVLKPLATHPGIALLVGTNESPGEYVDTLALSKLRFTKPCA
jgi:hypothetical protein